MEPKEKEWMDEVLGSLNGMERAEPNSFLFAKIEHRIRETQLQTNVPVRLVWLAAASFALLGLLNWQILQLGTATPTMDELGTVVTDMQLFPSTNQPYSLWSGQNY